jgi:hypothetical protein
LGAFSLDCSTACCYSCLRGESMTEELYQFVACDYFATGEGRTVMLLITRAYPHSDDYATPGDFTDGVYTPPTLKEGYTPKVIAGREFIEHFGEYFSLGAENLPREDFLKRYGHLLPDYVHRILNAEGSERPGNFNFKQSLHFNFS